MSIHALGNPPVRRLRWSTLLSLTMILADADNSIDPDRRETSQNAVGDSRGEWESTVSATAICAVRESADAFPPLKSVAGGLCSILENYDV